MDTLTIQPSYCPNKLLNTVLEHLHLRNDAALARLLRVAPPVISKLRSGKIPVGASMLIRMHEETGISIKELRDLMGDTRPRFMNAKEGKRKNA